MLAATLPRRAAGLARLATATGGARAYKTSVANEQPAPKMAFGKVDLGPTGALAKSLEACPTRLHAHAKHNESRKSMSKPSEVDLGPRNLRKPGLGARSNLTLVDFRSDTVTRPSGEMFAAMMDAQLGDDVFEEDPTVKELEERVAQLCGHEDALFCASGTMANQLAMRVHVDAMTSVLCDAESHIYNYECGGVGYHTQGQLIPVTRSEHRRHLTVEDVEPEIRLPDAGHPETRALSLENTMNGGVHPIESIRELRQMCDRYGLVMHCDGARMWNAACATGLSLSDYGEQFDSMCLSISKGLGAPIGSVLVGSTAFIRLARQFRKLFGGGWRQAGMLAACGLFAIEHNWPLMGRDHGNARHLAAGLQEMGFTVINEVETNMVFVDIASATDMPLNTLTRELAKQNIMVPGGEGTTATRFVTHLQTPRDQVDRTLDAIADLIGCHTRARIDLPSVA